MDDKEKVVSRLKGEKKRYSIPFTKTVWGFYEVKADSVEEAKEMDLDEAYEFENESDYKVDYDSIEEM